MTLRVNATVDAARGVAERFAQVAGTLAAAEEVRRARLADVNAAADAVTGPMREELGELEAQLEPWFRRNMDQLTGGKRKSAELGGCMLRVRAVKMAIDFSAGDDKAAVAVLRDGKVRWMQALTVPTFRLDKGAIAKAIEGKHGDALRALGFGLTGGTDAFSIERVEQAGLPAA